VLNLVRTEASLRKKASDCVPTSDLG